MVIVVPQYARRKSFARGSDRLHLAKNPEKLLRINQEIQTEDPFAQFRAMIQVLNRFAILIGHNRRQRFARTLFMQVTFDVQSTMFQTSLSLCSSGSPPCHLRFGSSGKICLPQWVTGRIQHMWISLPLQRDNHWPYAPNTFVLYD